MDFILNPNTLNKVSVFSYDGKQLLKKYIKHYQSGGSRSTNDNRIIGNREGGGGGGEGGGGGGSKQCSNVPAADANCGNNTFHIYSTGILNWGLEFDVVAQFTILFALKIADSIHRLGFGNKFKIIHYDPLNEINGEFQDVDKNKLKTFKRHANKFLKVMIELIRNRYAELLPNERHFIDKVIDQEFHLTGKDGCLPIDIDWESNKGTFMGCQPNVVIDNAHLFWFRLEDDDKVITFWNEKGKKPLPIITDINAINPGFPPDIVGRGNNAIEIESCVDYFFNLRKNEDDNIDNIGKKPGNLININKLLLLTDYKDNPEELGYSGIPKKYYYY